MEKEIKELVSKVCENWDLYKSQEVTTKDYPTSDHTNVKTLNGYEAVWDNPNLLWLLVEIEDGSYDGSGTQVGLTKDGKFMWEYQSHCSCNYWEDSVGFGDGELALDYDMTKKSYELSKIPNDLAKIIKVNLEEILKLAPSVT